MVAGVPLAGLDNLAHAGPFEISRAISRALHDNDPDRAAAAFARMERLDKRGRDNVTFSKDAVAEALTHTVWRDATIAIGITDHAVATGELAARSIVDPTKVSGDDQIKAGLHLQELEAALGRELDEATLSGLGIPPAADNDPAPTGNKKPEKDAEESPYAKWMRLIGEGPASAAEMRVHGLEHGFLEVKPESNEGDSNDG